MDMAIYTAFCLFMWQAHSQHAVGSSQPSPSRLPIYKKNAQKKFRNKLADELAEECRAQKSARKSGRKRKIQSFPPQDYDVGDFATQHVPMAVGQVQGASRGECAYCRPKGSKTARRKGDTSPHNVSRPMTLCKGCNVNLCLGDCWEQYHIEWLRSISQP